MDLFWLEMKILALKRLPERGLVLQQLMLEKQYMHEHLLLDFESTN